MKPQFAACAITFLGLSLSACVQNLLKDETGGKTELENITINGEYTMGIPTYMSKSTSLNDEASLQFQNIFKETYVIVIDESKQEYIDTYEDLGFYDTARNVISNYADTQVQSITSSLEVISRKEITPLRINGLSAAATEIDAKFEGVHSAITYFLTFVEGKEKLYMIMAWTMQTKKDNYRATFEQMTKSFRVFKKKPGTASKAPNE